MITDPQALDAILGLRETAQELRDTITDIADYGFVSPVVLCAMVDMATQMETEADRIEERQ